MALTDAQAAELKALAERQAAEIKRAQSAEHNPNASRWSGMDQATQEQQREVEARLAANAKAAGYTPPTSRSELGLRGARVLRALAITGNEGYHRVPQVLNDKFRDPETSKFIERALNTNDPQAGGVLVIPDFLGGEFIPLLHEESNVMALGAREITMPSGSAVIPGLSGGVLSGWVGEARSQQATRATFRRVKLSAKKAYALTAITRDLLEEASIEVDVIVRDDMIRGMAEVLDQGTLYQPGTEFSPRGIIFNPDKTAVNVGALPDPFLPTAFMAALIAKKVQFDVNPDTSPNATTPKATRKMGWLMGVDTWQRYYNMVTTTGQFLFRPEMREGRFMGFPYRVSALNPVGIDAHGLTNLFFGDWSQVVVGVTRQLEIRQSLDASYVNENDVETSAFLEDAVLIQMFRKQDSNLRQAAAMAVATNVYTIA